MPRDVFISHASEDHALAVEVCDLLEQRGLTCWIAPRDVGAGLEWDEAILDAIEDSHSFLLLLSSNANASSFVKNELNRAFSGGKPIVTFRMEDVLPGRSLELYLARHHWTDGFPPPLEPRVEQLAASLTRLLDPSRAARGDQGRGKGRAQAGACANPNQWMDVGGRDRTARHGGNGAARLAPSTRNTTGRIAHRHRHAGDRPALRLRPLARRAIDRVCRERRRRIAPVVAVPARRDRATAAGHGGCEPSLLVS